MRYMRLTQPLVDWCCTGHHSDRHAPVIKTPRLPASSSPITSNSVDGPLRTLRTSPRATSVTAYSGWVRGLGSPELTAGVLGVWVASIDGASVTGISSSDFDDCSAPASVSAGGAATKEFAGAGNGAGAAMCILVSTCARGWTEAVWMGAGTATTAVPLFPSRLCQ